MENLRLATKEELIEIIEMLVGQVEALQARVAELEEEVRRLRQGKGGGTPLAVKPSRPPKEKKPRRHRRQSFVRRNPAPTS